MGMAITPNKGPRGPESRDLETTTVHEDFRASRKLSKVSELIHDLSGLAFTEPKMDEVLTNKSEELQFVLDHLTDDPWDPAAIVDALLENPRILDRLDDLVLHIDLSKNSDNLSRLQSYIQELSSEFPSDWRKGHLLYALYLHSFRASLEFNHVEEFSQILLNPSYKVRSNDSLILAMDYLKEEEAKILLREQCLRPLLRDLKTVSINSHIEEGLIRDIIKLMPNIEELSISHCEKLTGELLAELRGITLFRAIENSKHLHQRVR
jgi:hypothetical protein